MGRKIDVIGKKYGRLTVIEEDLSYSCRLPSGALKHYYICECECGNTVTVWKQAFLNGHTVSCGCAKNKCQLEDLTGQKFNRLLVLGLDEEKNLKNKERYKNGEIKGFSTSWICKCDCGNISSATGYQIKSGHTKSCGCYQSEITSERNRNTSVKINRVTSIKSNDYSDEETYMKVYSDKNEDYFIVDKDDYDYISRWFWRKDRKGYWITNAKKDDEYGKTTLRLHQLIATRKYGEYDTLEYIPDHLNRNKSDNRKDNLELKTIADNARNRSLSKINTSGKTGVHWSKSKQRWSSYICVNYKNIYLGDYEEFENAVEARLKAEEKYGYICDNIIPENATEVI